MFAQFLTAFFWGIIVLFAFVGYGKLLNIILLPKKNFDFGMLAALGLVVCMSVGGFLNYFEVISLFSIRIMIGFGVLLFLFFLLSGCKSWSLFFHQAIIFIRGNKLFVSAVFFVFLIILVRYCFAVSFFGFNGADDYHGYMAFPAKMLQTGSLGVDPFNQRRIESSLGGQYFLHAIVLSATSFKNLHLTDNGLGYLIFIFLLIGFLREKNVDKFLALGVIVLMGVVVSPVLNITASYTAATVFFLFLRLSYPLLEFKSNSLWRNAFLIALPVFALCVLKSTYIIVAAILFVGYYFIYFRRLGDCKILKKEFILSILAIVFLLLPWMLSMLESSGTLLYPIFGRGYQATAYNTSEYAIQLNLYSLFRLFFESFTSLVTLLPLLVIAIMAYYIIASEEKKLLWLVFLSSFFGVLIIVLLIGGYSLYYYSFAYLFSSILFIIILSIGSNLSFYRFSSLLNSRLIGLLLIVFLFSAYLQKDLQVIQNFKDSINIGGDKFRFGLMNSNLINDDELKQYTDLQNAVPAGEIIISRLDRNFLFNFKRNRIYINDSPGGSSLPPGIPLKSGGEVMAEYFLSHDIKYIAYSYGNEANFSRVSVSGMLKPHVNPILRAISENGLAFQDNTVELSKSRKIIYDDGKNFVIDLSIKKK